MAGKYLKKAALRAGKKAIKGILKSTLPYWGPLVLLLLLTYSAYIILFEIPKEAIADAMVNPLTKVEAFLGTTEDPNAGKTTDSQLLANYKKIADTWDAGLSAEQIKQVQRYKFPYSVLMAVDRVVNDNAVWEGKQNVEPQPQKVFDALKPQFAWKDSTVTTVTVTTDANGKSTSSSSVQHVSLVTSAHTFEGAFTYDYEWKTTSSGNTTITHEEIKKVNAPDVYYVPLKDYLQSARGIKDEDTFEVVRQLALSYDPEYLFNLGLQMGSGQNFATSPAYALAYADAVQQLLADHPNIPQPLFLALIAHESGGNWQAVNQNSNGTTDAGLCQINSVNWGAYGLSDNPFNLASNVGAGASILGQALSRYTDFTKALYAYNGGTPQNGMTYNPTYAPTIMAIFNNLQATPAIAVYVPPLSSEPPTILAAEQNGQAWQGNGTVGQSFTNPLDITVIDQRTGETQKVERSSGDGTMWAAQAWVYHPTLKDMQKGDSLTVQFDDGQSTEIKITK